MGAPFSPLRLVSHALWRRVRRCLANATGVLVTTNPELPVARALAGLDLAQKSRWEAVERLAAGRPATALEALAPGRRIGETAENPPPTDPRMPAAGYAIIGAIRKAIAETS